MNPIRLFHFLVKSNSEKLSIIANFQLSTRVPFHCNSHFGYLAGIISDIPGISKTGMNNLKSFVSAFQLWHLAFSPTFCRRWGFVSAPSAQQSCSLWRAGVQSQILIWGVQKEIDVHRLGSHPQRIPGWQEKLPHVCPKPGSSCVGQCHPINPLTQ